MGIAVSVAIPCEPMQEDCKVDFFRHSREACARESGYRESSAPPSSVIPEKLVPAKAGIGNPVIHTNSLDSRVRGNDGPTRE